MPDPIINGIDVSNANGDVDMVLVREAGLRFCIAKATEGIDHQDPRFVAHMECIAELGPGPSFLPGAYHRARTDLRTGRRGGELEAQWFCEVLRRTAARTGLSLEQDFLEPVLAMETYDESDGRDDGAWIEGFLAVLEAETGRQGMIRTGANYWRSQLGDTDRFAAAGVALWQVHHDRDAIEPSGRPPRIPASTRSGTWTPSLWQWSGGGDFAFYPVLFEPILGITSDAINVDRVMGGEPVLAVLGATSQEPTPNQSIVAGPTLPAPAATVDLRNLRDESSPLTARIQGLLLSHGYGPGDMMTRSGRLDGISGPTTEDALARFKTDVGLPSNTIVDGRTWWMLVHHGLG